MRSHVKKNKEGKLVPKYETSYDVKVAQGKIKEAKRTMKHYKHISGIR